MQRDRMVGGGKVSINTLKSVDNNDSSHRHVIVEITLTLNDSGRVAVWFSMERPNCANDATSLEILRLKGSEMAGVTSCALLYGYSYPSSSRISCHESSMAWSFDLLSISLQSSTHSTLSEGWMLESTFTSEQKP